MQTGIYSLQQRREQSYRTLEKALQERTFYEIRYIIYQDALRLIPQIDSLHALRHPLIKEERIRFEIILKTSEVNIRTAYRTEIIITYEQFTMIKACRIEINLYASLYRFHHIRT